MDNKNQYMEEGWVKFFRYYCKEGFIDKWIGDCIDDPNNSSKSHINLNSFATFYRLNGKGKWVKRDNYRVDLLVLINSNAKKCTAEEIWEYYQLL